MLFFLHRDKSMVWGYGESYSLGVLVILGYFLLRFFSKLIAGMLFIAAALVLAAVFLKM